MHSTVDKLFMIDGNSEELPSYSLATALIKLI